MARKILKPLSLTGLLDETFDLYKKNFWLLLAIGGLVDIPASVLGYFLQKTSDPWSTILTTFCMVILYPIMYAASFLAVSDCLLGKKASILGSYRSVLPRLLSLIVTSLMYVVIFYMGLILCVVPGVIVGVWLVFVTPVFVLEGTAYWDALKRSKSLAKGNGNRIFWILFAFLIVHFLIIFGIMGASDIVTVGHFVFGKAHHSGIIERAAYVLWSMLSLPIEIIAITILYYDIRVRKEGFDIEMLAAELEENSKKKSLKPVEPEANLT